MNRYLNRRTKHTVHGRCATQFTGQSGLRLFRARGILNRCLFKSRKRQGDDPPISPKREVTYALFHVIK